MNRIAAILFRTRIVAPFINKNDSLTLFNKKSFRWCSVLGHKCF